MKKTPIVIIVLILVVLGLWFFVGKGNKVHAPTSENTQNMNDMQGMEEGPHVPIPPPVSVSVTTQPVNSAGVKEFTVSGQNFSFIPNVINVNKGDKVRIIFKNTSGMHDFRIDEFGIASKVSNSPYQEILEFTANKTGSFQYYCSVGTHRAKGMVGTLNVQ